MCEKLLFTLFLLFICLGALFMSHEQCTRHWSLKKKKKKAENVDAQSKPGLNRKYGWRNCKCK